MPNKVPDDEATTVKALAYELADDCNYLALGRVKSGQFMNRLVTREDVGGVVAKYVKRSEVRTYIKDAILNRYSKDKTQAEKPSDYAPIIKKQFAFASELMDEDTKGVKLFKKADGSVNKTYVIVAEGTFLKWETALRKALLRIGRLPIAAAPDADLNILLGLFAQYKKITQADKDLLEKSLSFSQAKVHIFGESLNCD